MTLVQQKWLVAWNQIFPRTWKTIFKIQSFFTILKNVLVRPVKVNPYFHQILVLQVVCYKQIQIEVTIYKKIVTNF